MTPEAVLDLIKPAYDKAKSTKQPSFTVAIPEQRIHANVRVALGLTGKNKGATPNGGTLVEIEVTQAGRWIKSRMSRR